MSQPAQQQSPPGHTGEMEPRPDHGEESYLGTGRLAGKRALITGADSGIGKAVAIAFAREGADVAFSHLPEEEDDGRDTEHWGDRGRPPRRPPARRPDRPGLLPRADRRVRARARRHRRARLQRRV